MKDTTFYPTAEQLPRLARGYRKEGDALTDAGFAMLIKDDPTSRNRYPAANGGLFSTAPDYTRFLQMILNGGSLDGKQYLKPETVKLMTSAQTPDHIPTGFTPGNRWGLGWIVTKEPQGVTATLSPGTHGHGGAWGTQGWIDPQTGLIYVMMVQRANFPNGDASDVRRAFHEAVTSALTSPN
jgi:CubicO group peptidase (beta-lactamase class C family)